RVGISLYLIKTPMRHVDASIVEHSREDYAVVEAGDRPIFSRGIYIRHWSAAAGRVCTDVVSGRYKGRDSDLIYAGQVIVDASVELPSFKFHRVCELDVLNVGYPVEPATDGRRK